MADNPIPVQPGYLDLPCPSCNEDYLHQGKVSIYHRDEEDSNSNVVTVNGKEIDEANILHRNFDGNPSARRQGLTIDFTCEACSALPQLCIAQHKGQTQIFWRNTGAR